MKKTTGKQDAKSYTISCTDEQLAAIQAGADQAGMKVSPWFVQCASTVDPWPKHHRRLVLEAKEQRYISRSARELARGLHSDGGTAAQFADDLRAVLEARLGAMVRQGRADEAVALLRSVFGEKRAEVVAAAFIPELPALPETTEMPAPSEAPDMPPPKSPERPEEDEVQETPYRDRPPQGELF